MCNTEQDRIHQIRCKTGMARINQTMCKTATEKAQKNISLLAKF
jgi:hypothetical protein